MSLLESKAFEQELVFKIVLVMLCNLSLYFLWSLLSSWEGYLCLQAGDSSLKIFPPHAVGLLSLDAQCKALSEHLLQLLTFCVLGKVQPLCNNQMNGDCFTVSLLTCLCKYIALSCRPSTDLIIFPPPWASPPRWMRRLTGRCCWCCRDPALNTWPRSSRAS